MDARNPRAHNLHVDFLDTSVAFLLNLNFIVAHLYSTYNDFKLTCFIDLATLLLAFLLLFQYSKFSCCIIIDVIHLCKLFLVM